MEIFIPEAVAKQAYVECDDDTIVDNILKRMELQNPVLFAGLKAMGKIDLQGAIILGVTCSTVYRMFEISTNLPPVSDEVGSPMLVELQRNDDEFLTRKLQELTEQNPHVTRVMFIYSEAASRLRADLKWKILKAALIFYSAIVSQIQADNLKEDLGNAL